MEIAPIDLRRRTKLFSYVPFDTSTRQHYAGDSISAELTSNALRLGWYGGVLLQGSAIAFNCKT